MFTRTYSAKEIHGVIVAKNIAMINNMIELQKKEKISAPEVVSNEYKRLCNLGLVNTKNAQILKTKIDEVESVNEGIDLYNADIDKRKEFCQFVKEMLEVFGHNTLLIRFEDFEQIVKKYNLTCGCLEDYTGVIPEKNLKELEEAKRNLKKVKDFKLDVPSKYIPVFLDLDIYKSYDYPYLSKNIRDLLKVEEVDLDIVDKQKAKTYKIFPFTDAKEYKSKGWGNFSRERETGIKVSSNIPTNLFIVAPYKDMKNGVKFSHFVKSEDPFICSYTPFGIMVHTAWGEEAEDEVLEKYYKQLNLMEQ